MYPVRARRHVRCVRHYSELFVNVWNRLLLMNFCAEDASRGPLRHNLLWDSGWRTINRERLLTELNRFSRLANVLSDSLQSMVGYPLAWPKHPCVRFADSWGLLDPWNGCNILNDYCWLDRKLDFWLEIDLGERDNFRFNFRFSRLVLFLLLVYNKCFGPFLSPILLRLQLPRQLSGRQQEAFALVAGDLAFGLDGQLCTDNDSTSEC